MHGRPRNRHGLCTRESVTTNWDDLWRIRTLYTCWDSAADNCRSTMMTYWRVDVNSQRQFIWQLNRSIFSACSRRSWLSVWLFTVSLSVSSASAVGATTELACSLHPFRSRQFQDRSINSDTTRKKSGCRTHTEWWLNRCCWNDPNYKATVDFWLAATIVFLYSLTRKNRLVQENASILWCVLGTWTVLQILRLTLTLQ